MAGLGKIARRGFLVGAATVAGGFAIGIYSLRQPYVSPLADDLPPGMAALTPHVLIDRGGITLITPRADMGQGATSIQAALIAEELDVALDAVRTDPGPPAPAYYNARIVAEGLPFAATDEGWMAEAAREAGGWASKLMALQITGGSSTVPDAYDRLRHAGAAARAILVTAAARRLGVAEDTLTTGDGAVIAPDGTRLSYVELAPAAGRLLEPREVRLKDPAEWRLLGRPMRRIDIVAKSTGLQRYGIDQALPGMLFAAVRTNPRRGGGVVAMDASAAEAMKGVVRVVPLPGGAGVLADSTWRAFEAVRAIRFDWGPAPYPATTGALFESIAAALDEDARDSRLKDEGDIEAALADGADVEADYRVPFLAHAPLEPMTALAWFRNGQLEVRAGTQIPGFAAKTARRLSGLSRDGVLLRALPMGGSFGRRLEDDFIDQAVRLAWAAEGRPVKLTWSREEDMTHDFPRPAAIARGRGRVAEGRVAALDLSIAAPSVSESQMGRLGFNALGADTAIVAGAWDQPFAIPAYRVTGYRAAETVPVSSWRSVGASANGFFHESLLDELIHEAGADPLAERLRLCSHAPSARVLEAVGEMSGWGGALGPGRGRGLAFTLSFGVPCAEVVEVTATDRGIRIDRVFVAAEVGRVLDPVNFENQVQGGVVWGLSHAIWSELTYADGRPEQENFDTYPAMRLPACPEIVVRGLETTDTIRGIGEPPVPPAAPALANAIFAATGQRVRELPLAKSVRFA
ncbi:xanthine dehydrogenase family protein molybdopterin-binding subunit [Rhodovulum euryhalinum]|uniref:Isoquinoline 1-oxidoreductase beta subunit n=1 Tax=Rhodovulum euryhalinum TaxID=35805 RepID=A0A4R2KKL0_9RHOB|nr:molybdopterin cofactor-binding domain-containing protein [Rhodovulum euryhalinum]TCO71176.1 isoquinoline 1-oxidoreductase beta subunit [Rhodovulum euryhalinum]